MNTSFEHDVNKMKDRITDIFEKWVISIAHNAGALATLGNRCCQARNFKPHNALVLKLHKMLNKDRPPELKKNKDKMMKKY